MTQAVSLKSQRSQTSHVLQAAAEREQATGQLLLELERRQDDVLSQLDELDQKLTAILRGLGVTLDDSSSDGDAPSIRLADLGDDDDAPMASQADAETDSESSNFASSVPFKRRNAA